VTDDPERQQLELARNGDPDAFSYFVERYLSRIYGVCFSFLGNRQDAEDCTQETFVKAFRSVKDYHSLAAFYTWIYRIAVNTCLDYKRKNSRAWVCSLDETLETENNPVVMQIADHAPLPDDLAESEETKHMIREEIAALARPLREIIVLRDLEGLSYHELAEIFRISEGTVKSRLSRARNQLMIRLRKREQTEENHRLKSKT